jgi:hypothetical protein
MVAMARRTDQATKKERDPLPEHFASIEEAASFWDTHDSSDYDEYFEDFETRSILKARLI